MKNWFWVLLILLVGCSNEGGTQVAKFESSDIANKVIVLLAHYRIKAELGFDKSSYIVRVEDKEEAKARKILTKFNVYFQKEDLNELLESKFASLSKLEMVKSNLLESREIYNKLSLIPGILRASVIVTGESNKRVSVLIMSLDEINSMNKKSIGSFLKGMVDDGDELTISYFVDTNDGKGTNGE